MVRRKYMGREEGTPHNKVCSLWSAEELYDLCIKAAAKACRTYGYPGESKDVAHDLWIYLQEQGHVVKCPEHKGAIFKFLTKCGRDNLRGRWNYDGRHKSVGSADSAGLELNVDYETADEKMLETIAGDELLTRILQQARGDQIKIIKGLINGATQSEMADRSGVKQYQISRWLIALRQRVR